MLLISGCTGQIQKQTETDSETVTVFFLVEANGKTLLEEIVDAEEESNVLKLLESLTSVETQEFSFGKFVTSIAGVEAGQTHYWAIYENGEYAKTGIEGIQVTNGLQIKFKLEEINM